MEMAVTDGKKTRPMLHCGICGEHGGDPVSVAFCHKLGLDYVSCSPFRVPIARLAAAQANIKNPSDIHLFDAKINPTNITEEIENVTRIIAISLLFIARKIARATKGINERTRETIVNKIFAVFFSKLKFSIKNVGIQKEIDATLISTKQATII